MKKIWTIVPQHFIMGGNVNGNAIATNVKPIEVKTIKGIEFFSFHTAKKTVRIAEGVSGGIIADSFEDLNLMIKGCSKKLLLSQIAENKHKADRAEELNQKKFFSYYKY